jgi:predicted HTH domain antitoxin
MTKKLTKMIELNIDGEYIDLPVQEMREYLKKRNIPTAILTGRI